MSERNGSKYAFVLSRVFAPSLVKKRVDMQGPGHREIEELPKSNATGANGCENGRTRS